MNSRNFSKVINNFWIIKRLNEDENRNIEFIVRWLRMSKINLLLWIDRYFKHQRKLDELNIKHKLKEERVNRIKTSIFEFIDINRRRCVTVLQMVEHINNAEIIKIIRPTIMRYILDSRTRWTLDGESLLNDLQYDSKIGSKKQKKF